MDTLETVPVLAAVPIKRFYVAKRRLAPLLDREARSRLGQDLALHTMNAVAATGAEVMALAADREVAAWAAAHGWEAVVDPDGGLNAAAASAAARAAAEGRGWLVIHADLPLLAPADLSAALEALEQDEMPIAPSDDGGTSLIGGRETFRFSYGPGSFHHHLARLWRPRVIVRRALALDLDGPSDYAAAVSSPGGDWLSGYAPAR